MTKVVEFRRQGLGKIGHCYNLALV